MPFESDLKLLKYGQLSPGAVAAWAAVSQTRASFVASWVVLVLSFSRPTLLLIPFESDLEWLSYDQLSSGAVVSSPRSGFKNTPLIPPEAVLKHP